MKVTGMVDIMMNDDMAILRWLESSRFAYTPLNCRNLDPICNSNIVKLIPTERYWIRSGTVEFSLIYLNGMANSIVFNRNGINGRNDPFL